MNESILARPEVKNKWTTPTEDAAIKRYVAQGTPLRTAIRMAITSHCKLDSKTVQRINRIAAQYEGGN